VPADGLVIDLTLVPGAGLQARVTETAPEWPEWISTAAPPVSGGAGLRSPPPSYGSTLITRAFTIPQQENRNE